MNEQIKTLLTDLRTMLYDLSKHCTHVLIKIDNLKIEIEKADLNEAAPADQEREQ